MGKYTLLKARNLYRRQQHAVRVINFKDKYFHAKPLLTGINILSVCETNIFQTFCLMFNCKIGITSRVFSDTYPPKPTNKYPLRSIGTLSNPCYRRKYSEFVISFRGPLTWNKILAKTHQLQKFSRLRGLKL